MQLIDAKIRNQMSKKKIPIKSGNLKAQKYRRSVPRFSSIYPGAF
jgi:hypothetical protein